MTDLSRLANIAEILSAIIVVGGIFFVKRHWQTTSREAEVREKVENVTCYDAR